jgi:hypothetical protein
MYSQDLTLLGLDLKGSHKVCGNFEKAGDKYNGVSTMVGSRRSV